jgi:hypothetical protein
MRSFITLLAGLGLVATHARDADAYSACARRAGWSLKPGTTLPKHPSLVFYSETRSAKLSIADFHAAIAGKSVPAKVTLVKAPPYDLAVVEIDSDKTGALTVSYGADAPGVPYTIDASTTMPKEANGATSRFHQAFMHSTVHEEEDGLAIKVDVPAIRFTARWRRDDKAPWQTIELPSVDDGTGRPTARIGELGCTRNFSVPLLESGIDLEIVATLPDRTTRPVKLPAHVTLAPLPPGTPRSSPP